MEIGKKYRISMQGLDVCIVRCIMKNGEKGVQFAPEDGGVFMPLWDFSEEATIEEIA